MFSNEVNIKFIILLATPDNKCHLRVLNELVEIFSDKNFVEEITKLTSIDKIYTLIQSYQFKSYTAMEE
jgi:mannitol/fructose-specific phosphotransferase system IIA component (Ntr-type)